MNFILFPTQLFELKYIPKEYRGYKFYLIEHDKFYGTTDKMNFNKKKIILHKASCLAYVDAMKNKIDIEYVAKYPVIKNSKVLFFDVVDHDINREVMSFYQKKGNQVEVVESPNFITNRLDLEKYYRKHDKKGTFLHAHFYKFQLKLHNVAYITKSYDVENRKSIPQGIKIPRLPVKNSNKYVAKAIEFVEKKFKKNYGASEHFYLPITHLQAKKTFDLFLKNRAKYFAEYQDAMVPQEPFLFHSCISAAMNIGLLNPDYVIEKITQAYVKKMVDIKVYEAFIRQVIGWREYQRFIYLFLADDMRSKNYFKNTGKLTQDWYEGSLGIEPVDDAIKMAFKYGYLHHILRLMVMCNFMNLCMIHPDQVYRWMMEFSVDSYEWVMIGNVYSMGMWSDGGMTMRKPYISSANYIQNMSGNRYKKGDWQDVWHALYYNFLMTNSSKLKKTIYIRNLAYLNKIDIAKIKEIKNISNNFIKKVTQ